MKPYRTDEFVHKLFYESARFTAFNNQWVVKAFINTKNQRDPTQCSDRDMKYQVRNSVLIKNHSCPILTVLHGMRIAGRAQEQEYTCAPDCPLHGPERTVWRTESKPQDVHGRVLGAS